MTTFKIYKEVLPFSILNKFIYHCIFVPIAFLVKFEKIDLIIFHIFSHTNMQPFLRLFQSTKHILSLWFHLGEGRRQFLIDHSGVLQNVKHPKKTYLFKITCSRFSASAALSDILHTKPENSTWSRSQCWIKTKNMQHVLALNVTFNSDTNRLNWLDWQVFIHYPVKNLLYYCKLQPKTMAREVLLKANMIWYSQKHKCILKKICREGTWWYMWIQQMVPNSI